jgi:hypothetical protein
MTIRTRPYRSSAWLARISLLSWLGAVLLVPSAAAGQGRAIQTTPDAKLMLVSKDVGAERWSIALNLSDGTAVGNVFPASGGSPSFVWCSAESVQLAANPVDTQYTLDCYGASACQQLPCLASSWTFIDKVTLSGSLFFQP